MVTTLGLGHFADISEACKERAEATEKGAAAEQEILKAKKRRDLQRRISPIDGTITNLAAWTVGGVVKPGDTILSVVPLSATPEIEAMVLNKDVGFVTAGQRATVKLEAFPFTRYGTVDGEVIDVSRDANKGRDLSGARAARCGRHRRRRQARGDLTRHGGECGDHHGGSAGDRVCVVADPAISA